MRFWDASAIVPLVARESWSRTCRSWLRADPTILVWALAATEVTSALTRQRRDGTLTRPAFLTAKGRLALLEEAWHEVAQLDAARARARRLLETHLLRAADALHLAAALVAFEERPAGVGFVTLDARLGEAARKEGFEILGEAGG